jgi:hypothetical protein
MSRKIVSVLVLIAGISAIAAQELPIVGTGAGITAVSKDKALLGRISRPVKESDEAEAAPSLPPPRLGRVMRRFPIDQARKRYVRSIFMPENAASWYIPPHEKGKKI